MHFIRSGKVVTVPNFSTLMRPLLKHCTELWGPQHMKDMDLLE